MANNRTDLGINVTVDSNQAVTGFQKVEVAVLALNASIIYVGKNFSQVAAQFDKEMRNVNALAQESEENFKKLSDRVRQFVNDPSIKDGPTKLASGLQLFISSGFESAEALEMVGVAAKSASAGLTDTKTSVDALSTLMNAYNQKTLKDSIQFSDQLFKVVDKGVISYEELAQNLGQVSAVASAASIDFKTVGASFIELTKNGIKANEAQTAIAGLIRELSNPNPEVMKFAKLLGADKSIGEYALKTKGLSGVLKELNEITGGSLTMMQKLIPESSAASAALVLAKNGGEGFSQALKDMNSSAGATDKALSQQMKSSAFQMEKLAQSVENLKITYGDLINETIKPLLEYFKYFLDLLNNLDTETKKNIIQYTLWGTIISTITIAITGLVASIIALKVALTPIITIINTFIAECGGLQIVLTQILKIFGALGIAGAFFYSLNTIVESLKNSTADWVKSLGEALETFDLIGKTKALITYPIAKYKQEQSEEELTKQKRSANLQLNNFEAKRTSGQKLTLDDYKKEVKALAESFTFIQDNEAKKRNILLRKEYSEKIKILEAENIAHDKAEKEKSIASAKAAQEKIKAAEEAAKKQEEFERKRKQLLSELPSFTRRIFNDEKQAILDKFSYNRLILEQEKQDRFAKLEEMKKYHIDTKNTEILVNKAYLANLKKLNQEQKEAEIEDLEDTKKKRKEALEFLENINKKITLINASELEKEKENNKNALKEIYKEYEAQKEKMSKAKDINGKNKFSSKDIKDFSNQFSDLYYQLEESLNTNLDKKTLAKNYIEQIDIIKEKLTDLSTEEDLLKGKKLNKEKTFWTDILNITKEALSDTSKLNEEDIKKINQLQKEAVKNNNKNEKEKYKLIEEGNKNIKKSIEEVINVFGILDKNSVNALSNIITFENGALNLTENLTEALKALSKDGLNGLFDFARNGGDLSGITGYFSLIVNQTKGMLKAVTDNIRKPENFKEFLDIANNIGEDFINTVTLGAVKSTKNFLGLKDSKVLFEEEKASRESSIKINKDKEKALEENYILQKDIIFRTIKDENEKNNKLKELDFQYTQDKFNFYKENQELEIKLTTDKTEALNKWYELEKETILQSEGNWQLRSKKLIILDNELQEKRALQLAEVEKLEAKLYSSSDVIKSIKEAKIEVAKINALNLSAADKEIQQLSIVQDLAIKLNEIKENGWKDIESLMSKYYDKEAKALKQRHQADYDNIKVREDLIKQNQKQIDKFQLELDKIEARYNKLLDNKKLSKNSYKDFSSLTEKLQNSGDVFSNLTRTPESEFLRMVAAKKQEIANQYEQDSDLAKKSEAMKALAIQENAYWVNISKNLVKGTKEYDEAVKNQGDAFKDFKEAMKDGIEAQKEYEIENANIDGSIINLKESIQSLTDKNKTMSDEINIYNNNISSDLDNLTSKFKNSAGEWELDLNKVRNALSGISSDSQKAINDLNSLIQRNFEATTTANQIIKDTSKPITANNVNTQGFNNIYGSNQAIISPSTSSAWKQTYSDQKQGESIDDYINRIKKEDALKQAGSSVASGALAAINKPVVSTASSVATSSNVYLAGSSVASGALAALASRGFSGGGISNGDKNGYLAKLHGKEVIFNENQGDNLAYLLKMANNPNLYAGSKNTANNYNIIINGSNLSKNELKSAMMDFYNETKQQEAMSYRGTY